MGRADSQRPSRHTPKGRTLAEFVRLSGLSACFWGDVRRLANVSGDDAPVICGNDAREVVTSPAAVAT